MNTTVFHVCFSKEPSFDELDKAIDAAKANPRALRARSITKQVAGRVIRSMSYCDENIWIYLDGKLCIQLFLRGSLVEFELLTIENEHPAKQTQLIEDRQILLLTPNGKSFSWNPVEVHAELLDEQIALVGAYFTGVYIEIGNKKTLHVTVIHVEELNKDILHFQVATD